MTGSVEVTNCFAVQHSDKADEVFLDKKFQQTMSDLHFRGMAALGRGLQCGTSRRLLPPVIFVGAFISLLLTGTSSSLHVRRFLDAAYLFNHVLCAPSYLSVNPKESIVGWYATSMDGAGIVDSSSLIHDFYSEECEDPVHLVVDTAMQV